MVIDFIDKKEYKLYFSNRYIMAFQFNSMPPRPQKSFFPKAQKNSTANSYYQQRVTNRAVMNEYQL